MQAKVLRLCEQLRDRVPLVLLEGDVGTGKTALAETISDALARKIGGKTKVHLLMGLKQNQAAHQAQIGLMSGKDIDDISHKVVNICSGS